MPGFPLLPSRQAFGEILEATPELNPRTDIGGARFNLAWWQLAGAGLMVARALVLVSSAGAIVSAAEAWNPNQDLTMHPVVVHPATGCYALIYPSSALDDLGVSRLVGLQAVDRVTPQPATVPSLGWEAQGAIVSPSAWQTSHAYAVGAIVSNGGKLYYCFTAGTSAGSGGPTGTAADITDNGAHWAYLSTASGVVVVSIATAQSGTLADVAFLAAVR